MLRRKKFHFTEELIQKLLAAIEACGLCVEAVSTGELLPDEKDLPFYEVVMSKQEDEAYLVTGNIKHFPKKPFIVTARELLDILEAKG